MPVSEKLSEKPKYNPSKIEPKWQKLWRKKKIYQPNLKSAKNPFYNLMMFPYPSAEGLHVGNMYAFTGSDIYGRYKRMCGFDVFEPIGLDGFGIHSENYALKVGEHPARLAKKTQKRFYQQLEKTGNAYAWDNKLETYDPNYYKWTQWLFLKMYKKGLVVRKKSLVNWCPSCKTVLADEQVEGGVCERCKTKTTRKETEQWFFKITNYAERLLKNLEWINWSERVKTAQRNWIGKSEGAVVKFLISNPQPSTPKTVEVFTTRIDTIFGVTFLVAAPEHPIFDKLKLSNEVLEYRKKALAKTEQKRRADEKEKTGVYSGYDALHPITGKKIPIWMADFILMDYGTGAVMGVPAHDQRDFEFANKYNLPIKQVIKPIKEESPRTPRCSQANSTTTPSPLPYPLKSAYEDYGILVDSGQFTGLKSKDAILEITKYLKKKGCGKYAVNYHLRDWLISRQRYWGPPIPMIKCPKCGFVPVPEKDLPVLLPYVEDYRPKGLGKSPLAYVEDFINVKCPKCGRLAKRETDVSDTFLDSSWYFLRYPSSSCKDKAFDKTLVKKWLPVDMYIGGAEHAVLHLLYTRFITMALHDFGYLEFEEPFKRFYAHGLITKDGAKMSKSKGNVVIPDNYIKKYGADTLRMYLMFLGPFDHGGDFTDAGIKGIRNFLERVWDLSISATKNESSSNLKKELNKLVKKVTEDIEKIKFNTAIAAMMKFKNLWAASKNGLSKDDALVFLKLLAPFAPHITEELWSILHKGTPASSIHIQSWPRFKEGMLNKEEVSIIVQVDGKLKGVLHLPREHGSDKEYIINKAKQIKKLQRALEGRKVLNVIFIPNRLLNFVLKS